VSELLTYTETFLLDDEAIDAETFVTKASVLMNNVSDVAINLRYRVIYARVLDANRKFLEAASRYFELSITTVENVWRHDLILKNAVHW
jgi:COP9 signalosome complex subunit 4